MQRLNYPAGVQACFSFWNCTSSMHVWFALWIWLLKSSLSMKSSWKCLLHIITMVMGGLYQAYTPHQNSTQYIPCLLGVYDWYTPHGHGSIYILITEINLEMHVIISVQGFMIKEHHKIHKKVITESLKCLMHNMIKPCTMLKAQHN